MASLLDLYVQRALPEAGLLSRDGRPPLPSPNTAGPTPAVPSDAVQPPAQKAGFLDKLFAGGIAPSLSPEQNDAIKKRALLTAGLATLSSIGNQDSGLAAAAKGALLAQQQAQGTQQGLVEQQRKQRQAGALVSAMSQGGQVTRSSLDRAITLATGFGDQEVVKNLTSLRSQFGDPTKFEPTVHQLADGRLVTFDPNKKAFFAPNGQRLMSLPKDFASTEDKLQYVGNLVDKNTGESSPGVVNLTKGTFVPIHGVAELGSGKGTKVSTDSIEAAKNAQILQNSYDEVSSYLQAHNWRPPSALDLARFESDGTLTTEAGFRSLSNEDQKFLQAQESMLLTLTHQLAGVRGISAKDARSAIRHAFGFTQGDSPGNIQSTLHTIATRIAALKLQGADALDALNKQVADMERAKGFTPVGAKENSDNPFGGI